MRLKRRKTTISKINGKVLDDYISTSRLFRLLGQVRKKQADKNTE